MSRWFYGSVLMFVPALSLAGCGEGLLPDDEPIATASQEAVSDCSVAWEKELMITDLRVVGDARAQGMGPWSFGGIMTAMAGTRDVQQFVKGFVESWLVDQNIDGVVVKARPKMQDLVLGPWRARSPAGTYDLATAPFQLLAIVYRVDLRKIQNTGDGAGEGRFVFGVLNQEGRPMPFTMITEFALPIYGGRSARDWANDWHALGKLALGSPEYNQKLEEITNKFASSAAGAGSNPGTDLNQLRTNEIALDLGTGHAPVWELREFHIESDGFIHPARPARTPMNEMNGTDTLSKFVKQNARKIEDGTYKLPTKFQGKSFSAGSAAVPSNAFKWNVPNVDGDLQDEFSKQTCNGCHAGNTGTNFLHVAPPFAGGAAKLSGFVVNTEMPRRSDELKELLGCDD